MKLATVKAARKALGAALGGGGAALAVMLPDGLTQGELYAIASAAVGAAVATWWTPPNVPRYRDTPQDTP